MAQNEETIGNQSDNHTVPKEDWWSRGSDI